VFDLADTLEVLNLSNNQLTSLPHDLPRLHRLKVIFCSDNPFTELPEVLGDCAALQQVGFKACRIAAVPRLRLAAPTALVDPDRQRHCRVTARRWASALPCKN
jgi:Leucine-rich repeat (LRR) protein